MIALEYASGGELFDFIAFSKAFEEQITRTYFQQLIQGLHAAHSLKICHRDLKPENLLLDGNFELKICDFGLAKTMSEVLYTECGTKGYMAPELFGNTKGYDGFAVDVWACGVILFTMLTGFPPYMVPKRSDWWFEKLVSNRLYLFWQAHIRHFYFNEEIKDLLNKMYAHEPEKRIILGDIMKHKWYVGGALTGPELKKNMMKRKEKVENENSNLRKKKKQESIDSAKIVRGNKDAAESKEIPSHSPPSIILIDHDMCKGKKIQHVPSNSEDFSYTAQTDDDKKDSDDEKKDPAPIFKKSLMTVFTKFYCAKTPREVNSALVKVFAGLQIHHIGEKNYHYECSCETLKGTVKFHTTIYAHAEDNSKCIIECKKLEGYSISFRETYAAIRNEMDKYAEKREKVTSKIPEIEDSNVIGKYKDGKLLGEDSLGNHEKKVNKLH